MFQKIVDFEVRCIIYINVKLYMGKINEFAKEFNMLANCLFTHRGFFNYHPHSRLALSASSIVKLVHQYMLMNNLQISHQHCLPAFSNTSYSSFAMKHKVDNVGFESDNKK